MERLGELAIDGPTPDTTNPAFQSGCRLCGDFEPSGAGCSDWPDWSGLAIRHNMAVSALMAHGGHCVMEARRTKAVHVEFVREFGLEWGSP